MSENDADCAVTATSTSDYIKWNPGHYMIAPNGSSLTQRLGYLDAIANEPTIKGMQVRYFWRELEPTKGNYNFSAIEKLLEKARAVNKQIIVEVWTRSFGGQYKPSPDYAQTSAYGGGDYSAYGDGTRFGTRIWNPAIVDRLIALYTELGKRFNGHEHLEAISTMETALGRAISDLPDYSASQATEQYIRLVNSARAAFPNTIVRHAVNFWSDRNEFVRIHENAPGQLIGLGGPDVRAGKTPSQMGGSQPILLGEVGGVDYRGIIPIMFSAEQSDTSEFAPDIIYGKATEVLKTSHLSWLRNTWAGPEENLWETGILPFIRSIDGHIASPQCPSAFQKRCRGNGG